MRKKKLRRWHVVGKVVGSKYLGIYEAETAEEAIEKALGEKGGMIGLCHHCASECEDGEIEDATADEAK